MTPPEITLRDRFAEAALTGLLASKEHEANPNEWFACNAWGVADAMIAERERRAEEEAKDAEREAREWVASAGLAVAPNAWGGVYLTDGGRVIGCGHDLVAAVADAMAMLAAKPTPPAPEAQPAPSTPTAEDDEAWARKKEAVIEPCEAGWYVYYLCEVGIELTHARGPTIAKALRALRSKVEGGQP